MNSFHKRSLGILAFSIFFLSACSNSSNSNDEDNESSVAQSSHALSSHIAGSSAVEKSSAASSASVSFAKGEPVEIDGQSYKTVVIGSQTWMAENLNVVPAADSSWCYNNEPSNCDIYGRLYRFDAAMAICPTGWHLPDTTEWNTLEAAVGSTKKLRSTTSWKTAGSGTDDYSFSVLPAGYIYEDAHEFLGETAFFWTSTSTDDYDAWHIQINDYGSTLFSMSFSKSFAYSVRCLKD